MRRKVLLKQMSSIAGSKQKRLVLSIHAFTLDVRRRAVIREWLGELKAKPYWSFLATVWLGIPTQ